MNPLEKRIWWSYLQEDIQELLKESIMLSEKVSSWDQKFHDYSFVVFPAAKAYEGFLKKLFLDLGFITTDEYYGKRFRIGKALNPSLEKELRGGSVYDKIVEFCGGSTLGDKLWETWKSCRNSTFHWFPEEKTAISLPEAKEKLELILVTMDAAFRECKINS